MPRITIFAGHYGSGKTLLAVNYALRLRREYERVILADLDIVNPYYRTTDFKQLLDDGGIRLIASEYAGSAVEVPGFPPDAAAALDDENTQAVLDVGGDDRGALALGRFAPRLRGGAEMLLVINAFRPMTKTPKQALEIMTEIESASRLRFTGICNNSHWGTHTCAKDVLESAGYAEAVAEAACLPVLMTSADRRLCPELDGKVPGLFPLHLFPQNNWGFE